MNYFWSKSKQPFWFLHRFYVAQSTYRKSECVMNFNLQPGQNRFALPKLTVKTKLNIVKYRNSVIGHVLDFISCADPIAMLVEHWFICLIGDIALVMENKN